MDQIRSVEENWTEQLRLRLVSLITEDPILGSLLPFESWLERAKFSRARLLMKCSLDNGGNPKDAFEACVGIELVHLATLVHDDVIDAADLRRNQASMRSLEGDHSAVLFGDYLFALAVEHIQKTQVSGCTSSFLKAVKDTCRGETVQDLWLDKNADRLKLDNLLDVARGKTGALFSFCMEAPVWLKGDLSGENSPLASEMGSESGLAYQLADDVLDITGEKENLGKAPCTDLVQGCMTTPLFLFMQEQQLSWAELRQKYKECPEELSQAFIQSQTLDRVTQLIESLEKKCFDLSRELGEKGFQFQETLEKFWERYIHQRVQFFKDCSV